MFLEYSELLNALDSGATTKITINNRRLNKADFEQTILIPMAEDGLDKYRKEYNRMLLDKATGANSIVQDKYVTISVCKKNIEEARNYFARVGADLIGHFNRLGSKCTELDANDKLRIFHDFYRTGEEGYLKSSIVKGDKFADKAIYEISDKGRYYFEQLMNSYANKEVSLLFDFNVVIANLNKMEKGKALELVKSLRNSIVSSANTTDQYAAEYPDIPLVGKSIFEQQKLLYCALLEWLDNFENQFKGS